MFCWQFCEKKSFIRQIIFWESTECAKYIVLPLYKELQKWNKHKEHIFKYCYKYIYDLQTRFVIIW